MCVCVCVCVCVCEIKRKKERGIFIGILTIFYFNDQHSIIKQSFQEQEDWRPCQGHRKKNDGNAICTMTKWLQTKTRNQTKEIRKK